MITIEVALTIGAYLMVIFMIFEMGRIAITQSYWDLAVTDAVRVTKNSDLMDKTASDISAIFKKKLLSNYNAYVGNTFMGLFAYHINNVDIKIKFANKIDDLANNSFSESGRNALLACYDISYHYSFFIPLPFISQTIDSLFERQFFIIQRI